jgi:hypothetical protein
MTTVVILQPGYLPWLGFFDQMRRSDVFVYYDDVQFDKHGWRNRNRIKTPAGPLWLSVPVLHSGRHGQPILEVEIDNRLPWARKQISSIRQNYAKAPYLDDYLPGLNAVLQRSWKYLVDLDMRVVELMGTWLDIQPRIARSSELGIEGKKSARLLDICRHFGADCYISGDAAKDYLDSELFAANGVRVEWQEYQHPVYPQLHGDFLPYLSALDMVLNTGATSQKIIKRVN